MKLQGMSAVTQILSLERGILMCITTNGVCIADISDVKPRLGEAAEVLRSSSYTSLLGIRKSTSSEVVVEVFCRCPMQICFWQ